MASNAVDVERKGSYISNVDINNNTSGKIENPLAHQTRSELLAGVAEFAERYGMQDILPILERGALVAQRPEQYESVEGLLPEEREAIAHETANKWSHPFSLYATIVTCSIGAAVQGWDQTGSNGANLAFPDAFGIGAGSDYTSPNQVRDNWLVGLVNSAPYIGSAFIGCWISDPVNNYLGRRGTIFISGVFCLLTPIGSAFTQTWPQLFIARILMGIGMGMKGSTVPIFAAENSPARIRGALVMSWQMWTAFGIMMGNAANLVFYNTGAIAWRLQLGSAFLPAIPLVIGIFFCPESPRWCIKKDRVRQAYESLRRLRFNEIQAARDLYYMYSQIQIEKAIIGDSNYFQRFFELFTIPRVRRATLAAFTVMIAQQMCGINIIAFYSSTVFANAGASTLGALLASFGFGIINFVFAFPAIFTIDTYGRRTLLLFTFPNMAWSLLTVGLCNLIDINSKAHLGLMAFFIYVFAAFYSPGEGPVPFTYSAEVFPLSHREIGMGFSVATCLFWASVLSMSFPSILAAFTITGAFGFYAGMNIVAFCMIFLFVPETKQRTLEELDYIFAVPTRKFIRHHATFQKHSLYHWDDDAVASSDVDSLSKEKVAGAEGVETIETTGEAPASKEIHI